MEGPCHVEMNVLTWNLRDLNASNKKCIFKHYILKIKEDIILLKETKLKIVEIYHLRKSLGFKEITNTSDEGASRGNIILWD